MKTILVHAQDGPDAEQIIDNALALGRGLTAHLEVVQITPFNAYLAADGMGVPLVVPGAMEVIDEEAGEFARKIKDRLHNEDVTWSFSSTTGDVATALIRRAALADIVVTSRRGDTRNNPPPPLTKLGELLRHSRTPLFIPGEEPVNVVGRVVIAWNGSYQAANAVRAAVPLLKLAEQIRVVQVEEKPAEFPSTKLLEYLSRHDIKPEMTVEAGRGKAIEEIILDHVDRDGASYLVMGGYGHRRVTEYIFGGMTRDLLRQCPVGLFVAH